MSETIFSNSLIFQESAQLKYTLKLKISESQNLTNAKISRPVVLTLSKSRQFLMGKCIFFTKDDPPHHEIRL